MWQLGGRPFEVLGDGRLAVLHGLGEFRLGLLDPDSGALTDLDLPGYRTADAETRRRGLDDRRGGGRPAHPVERAAGCRRAAGSRSMKRQPIAAPDPAYLPDARPVRLPGRSER